MTSAVQSVIVGKRAEVSDFRRKVMGSASESVQRSCRLPVRVVYYSESTKGTRNAKNIY